MKSEDQQILRLAKRVDELVEIVAKQTTLITELTNRVVQLEGNSSVDGVFYDGTPAYVRDYFNKEREGKE